MRSITVQSNVREEMIDITREVSEHLLEAQTTTATSTTPSAEAASTPPIQGGELLEHSSSSGSGIVILFVQHTTCGLTINENADPDVRSDMLGFLRRLIPQAPTTPSAEAAATPPQAGGEFVFKHVEGNSDAHIKSSLVGSSVTVPFEDGKLQLGRWQGIYLCEFDGPRERTVLVKIL